MASIPAFNMTQGTPVAGQSEVSLRRATLNRAQGRKEEAKGNLVVAKQLYQKAGAKDRIKNLPSKAIALALVHIAAEKVDEAEHYSREARELIAADPRYRQLSQRMGG